jgi:hypothetical protein
MKVIVLSIGVLAVLLSSISGRAAYFVDERQIAENLCPKNLCLYHWNSVTAMMCNNPIGQRPARNDYVFGSYLIGRSSCLCPCKFSSSIND